MTKTWGPSTWKFFHTLAEQIPETTFQNNSTEICNMYVSICSNLPCIECTKHARQYVGRTLNPRFIQTKSQLKQFLFDFHNSVNVRLNKPVFTDYHIYKTIDITEAYVGFRNKYISSYNAYNGFHETLFRNHLISSIDNLLIKLNIIRRRK